MTTRWGNPEVAELIVKDTILAAHTKPLMAKDATVLDSLDLLAGPNGNQITQALLGEYLLSYKAAEAAGVNASIDKRILTDQVYIVVSATELKVELQRQLQDYLSKPDNERNVIVQALISEQVS